MTTSHTSPTSASSGSSRGDGGPESGRRRRRWPLVVGGLLVLLVVLVLIAPVIAASVARGRIVSGVAESLNATASVGDLSLSLGGHVQMRDFALADTAGQPVLALSDLDVQADVLGALSGKYRADVTLRGLVLHVRQLPDGRLNLAALPRDASGRGGDGDGAGNSGAGSTRGGAGAGGAGGGSGSGNTGRGAGGASEDTGGVASDGPLPDVAAHVLVENATVIVHAPDGRETQLKNLTLRLDLTDLAQPATFALGAQLTGPAGAAGSLKLDGSATLAHGGRIDPQQLSASLDYALDNLLLAGLQPALDTVASGAVRELRGTLAGSGHWTVEGLTRVNGKTEIRADGLHLQGGAADSPPLDLPSLRLAATASVDAEGSGSQLLELTAGDVLAVRWDGTAKQLALPNGSLSGTLSVDSRLGGLLALLREPLGLKAGLDVGATLALKSTIQAGLGDGALAGPALASLALTSDLTLKDIAARDERGQPLDLGELTSLTAGIDGRMDLAAGRFDLSRFTLAAGPVQASAHGSVSGLPVGGAPMDAEKLSVADSELLLDADLDRLARAAGQFMELGETSFGGKVHVKATAATTGRQVDAISSVELVGLRLTLPRPAGDVVAQGAGSDGAGASGAGAAGAASSAVRSVGPIDLTFAQTGRFDLSPGGAFELSSLTLRSAFAEIDGSGRLTDALDAARRAGSVKLAVRVKPGVASSQLAGLLDGASLEGQDVTIETTLQLQGPRTDVVAAVRAPALTLRAGVTSGGATSSGVTGAGSAGSASAGSSTKAGAAPSAHTGSDAGAIGAEPLSLTGLSLDSELSFDSVAQLLDLKALKLQAGPSHAAGKDLPGLALTARGAWDGARGTLDVPELALTSGVASGGGRLSVGNLSQPDKGLSVQADVRFSGDAEPARALLAAFVPELAAARAAGSWDLALQADTSGTLTHATPKLGLHGVTLDGYVSNGKALPLKDVDLSLEADLSADTSGTGKATLTSLSLKAPGLTLTADGRASGYAQLAPTNVGPGATAAVNPIPAALDAGMQASFTLQPRELSERLAAFLGGLALGGETLTGKFQADVARGALVAKGGLASRELQITLPADELTGRPVTTLVQRDLSVDLDATADLSPGRDSVTLRSARFASRTAEASVTGTLGGVMLPESASADVTFAVRSELARVFEDLGALLPPGWSGRGALALDGTLKGNAGQLALKSATTIDKLSLTVPRPPTEPAPEANAASGAGGAAGSGTTTGVASGGASGAPLVIDDPRVAIDLDASLATGPMDVVLSRAQIASTFLSGQLTGKLLALNSPTPRAEQLKGDFTWVPGRVGALLGPMLPGQLTGDEPQPLKFTLDGPLPKGDLPALLAALNAGATIGLGNLALPGLAASGTTTMDMTGGRAHVIGKFTLNGGSADLDGLFDLRPEGTSAAPLATRLKLDLKGLKISQEMAEILARIHPLLAMGEGQSAGVVSGAIGGSLLLDWPAALPLPAATPATDVAGAAPGAGTGAGGAHAATGADLFASLPLEKLSGNATLDFGTLTVVSSPLLGEMLGNLGVGGTQQFTLAPVKLVVKDGRVGYAEPWGWNIKDFATTFSGSVGFDQTLDLNWGVPITDALAAKHGFLKDLKGQSLSVPLRGSVAAPDLQWTAALQGLAEQALQAKLQSKLGDKLGPLGGLLGGKAPATGDKPAAGATPDSSGKAAGTDNPAESAPVVTAASLLAQADALWDKGDKEGAKPLYKQLKSDFKLSLEFQLNKKRIEDRAKWKP